MRAVRPRVLAIPALACAVISLACNSSTSASAIGTLSAQVVDANNAGVQSVNADLYKVFDAGPVLWRSGLTSSNGIAVFGANEGGVVAGNYYVHLSFVTNYRLAIGETNDKAVTVSGGDDHVVVFHVEAAAPGGPGS